MSFQFGSRRRGHHDDDGYDAFVDQFFGKKKTPAAPQHETPKISDPGDAQEQQAEQIAGQVAQGGDVSLSGVSASPAQVQTKSEGGSGAEATPEFSAKLNASKGGGQTLPGDTRAELEQRMSADFSDVKVHTGDEANTMSKDIHAKAFTHGQDIYFGENQYDPRSQGGKQLLAHELVHTKQQQGAIYRQRLLDFVAIEDKDLNLSNSDIENTNEYKSYMNPDLVWQKELKMTADEARTACLMILGAMRAGTPVNWQADARSYAMAARERLERGADKPSHDRLSVEISVVDQATADRLFSEMANLTFFNDSGTETPIPYTYPIDGCYARAHMMEQRLTALGFKTRNVYGLAMGGALKVQSEYSAQVSGGVANVPGSPSYTRWRYHIAPIITMLDDKKQPVDMVIDPSIASGPITIDQWMATMGAATYEMKTLAEVKTMTTNIVPVAYITDRDSWAPKDSRSDLSSTDRTAIDNSARTILTGYAALAPENELAHLIRTQILASSIDVDAIILKIQSMSSPARLGFISDFSTIYAHLKTTLTKEDFDKIDAELKK